MAEPSSSPEARAHPRYVLSASVLLKQEEGMVTLSVDNISLGGAFIAADRRELESFPVGSRHKVILFDPNDLLKQTAVTVEVIRHDPSGIGIAWFGENARVRIALLLEELIPSPG